jgi:hypothetical protein
MHGVMWGEAFLHKLEKFPHRRVQWSTAEPFKIFACMFGVICPLIIVGSSVAAYRGERDYFLAKYTRDAAQIMYFLITMIGLFEFGTSIHFGKKQDYIRSDKRWNSWVLLNTNVCVFYTKSIK